VEPVVTPSDPTARPEWDTPDRLPEQILDDPLIRTGAPRGVQPWQITPGEPPVRGAAAPRGRTLLRDATIRRRLLRKASATPVPATPRSRGGARGHEHTTAAKPAHHEGEFFKPAQPLLTNIVVDRPPAVQKSDNATWDDLAPVRTEVPSAAPRHGEVPGLVHARTTPLPAPRVDDLEDVWFLDADGTLEPPEERGAYPTRRIAGWIVGGAALTALVVLGVAVLQGPTVQATPPSAAPARLVAPPLPPVEHTAAAPTAGASDAPDATATTAVPEPTKAPEPAASEPAAPSKPAPVMKAPVPPRDGTAAQGSATAGLDRLRAAMADNPLLAPEEPQKPSGPVEKKLWSHIEKDDTTPAQPLWSDLSQGADK